jgi:hypothetical protein
MALPLITDPFFYAVAIPSVLLMGISKSGFGTGFGSLAVPLMALAVTVPEAAAIMMPVLFLTDILGLAFLRSHLDWRLLRFLVPCGLVGTVLGFLLFRLLNSSVVEALVGGFTLLFLAQRLLGRCATDRCLGLHQLYRACRRPSAECLRDSAQAQPAFVHLDHGVFLFRHQPVQVDSLRLFRSAGYAQYVERGGTAAAGAIRRVDRREHGSPH